MAFVSDRFAKAAVGLSALESPPKRRAAADRRAFHDDEASTLKMLHKPLRDDLGHDLVGVVDAPAALLAQREGERRGQVGGVGEGELVGVKHWLTIAGQIKQIKNIICASRVEAPQYVPLIHINAASALT